MISDQVINNLPIIDDWLDEQFIKNNKLTSWNKCIKELHNPKNSKITIQTVIEDWYLMNCVQIF